MVGVYEPKITNCCVANLGNSLAITCDLRLALGDLASHIHSPRINQSFLYFSCLLAEEYVELPCRLSEQRFQFPTHQAADGAAVAQQGLHHIPTQP